MSRWNSILLLLSLLMLDRVTKIFIMYGWRWEAGIVRLERFDNHGLVFSIPVPQNLAIGIVAGVIVGLLAWVWRHRKKLPPVVMVAAGCIVVGAVSNFFDRIWYGVVIDWISFGRWFPIFNIADVSIFLGIVVWVRHLTKTQSPS